MTKEICVMLLKETMTASTQINGKSFVLLCGILAFQKVINQLLTTYTFPLLPVRCVRQTQALFSKFSLINISAQTRRLSINRIHSLRHYRSESS